MNGAETIIQFLEKQGVRVVFGMPGGANLPLYDALASSRIESVLARHEQGAAFMAQGYARKSGEPGVCFATSGPGAANLVTAVADAKADSVPLIAVTGQVSRHLIGTDAFQELDVISLARPITKLAVSVHEISRLGDILEEAWQTAVSGRPGPVWIDIPRDVQLEEAPEHSPRPRPGIVRSESELSGIERFSDMLAESKRPLLYFGGGILKAKAGRALYRWVEQARIPAVSSLNALGVFSYEHELYAGFVGVYGFPAANTLVRECDLLIAVGARFDDRATGEISKFCPNARIVHADIDPRETGKLIAADLAFHCDAAEFLARTQGMKAERKDWIRRLEELRKTPLQQGDMSDPEYILSCVDTSLFGAVTTDVGLHQMWAARNLDFAFEGQFITSGGMGTMGFGLPAAAGACFADDAPALCITGDGSILLNFQEFAVISEYGLPVKVVLFDNGHLGMVRSQQERLFQGRLSSSAFAHAPDFAGLARSFGIPAYDCPEEDEFRAVLAKSGPAFVRFVIDPLADVSSKIAPARFARIAKAG